MDTEKAFQTAVVGMARLCGWEVYHTYDSRRSMPGYPDLTLWHPQRGVLFRELKTQHGRVTPAQQEVLDGLVAAGADAGVWRPSDWPEIEMTLGVQQ